MDENPYKAPQSNDPPRGGGKRWYNLSRFDDPDSDLPSTKWALIAALLGAIGGALAVYF